MKKQFSFYIKVSIILFSICFGSVVFAELESSVTSDQALQSLVDGNNRFIAGTMSNIKNIAPKVRKSLVSTQKPYAVILSCSDSRVPPEIIFDQGLGEIFVARVAGNIIGPEILGSIEYGVKYLGSPLIIVLGHENCGAVSAAVDNSGKIYGHVKSIIKAILPAVKKAKQEYGSKDRGKLIEVATDENIRLVATDLVKRSSIIKKLVHNGKVKIVTAKYDLETGKVRLMQPILLKQR